jgi:hypothetical protein
MKTDSERQTAYQLRRRNTEDRITLWVDKDVELAIETLRGSESRTTWINRAITELIIRQLLSRPFPFTDEEYADAKRLGRDRGIMLP